MTDQLDKDGETLVQYLSKLQFNAAKWAYMKLHEAITEEDAAAKLFADRQAKAAQIESYITSQVSAQVEAAEQAGRRKENHYWADEYSREIKALDGWEDLLAINRAKIARKLHQDRLAALHKQSKACPACERGVPAHKTKVMDTTLLCDKHQSELDAWVKDKTYERRD